MLEPDAERGLVTDADRLTPFGSLPPLDQPRRAADAVERAQGRHEPGRSSPAAGAVPRPLHRPSRRGDTRCGPASPAWPRSAAATRSPGTRSSPRTSSTSTSRSLRSTWPSSARTVGRCCGVDGISAEGDATMPEFSGGVRPWLSPSSWWAPAASVARSLDVVEAINAESAEPTFGTLRGVVDDAPSRGEPRASARERGDRVPRWHRRARSHWPSAGALRRGHRQSAGPASARRQATTPRVIRAATLVHPSVDTRLRCPHR